MGDDVYEILSLQSCLDKRCAKGGVSPLRVAEAIAEAKTRFASSYFNAHITGFHKTPLQSTE